MRARIHLILFAFVAVPVLAEVTISRITPASGLSIGGEYVHIHGHDLIGRPLACPGFTCANYVKFGDTLGTIITNTEDEIVAFTPSRGAGVVDVEINVAGKTTPPRVITAGYRFLDPPNDDLERFLIPVTTGTTGAFGSIWATTVLVHNSGTDPVSILLSPQAIGVPPAGLPPVPPLSVSRLSFAPGTPGVFLYIPRRSADFLTFNVRVADTSRSAENFGTEIPVIPELQFKPAIQIIGIPTDPGFRAMLRMYGYDGTGKGFQIDLRDDFDSTLLATITTDSQAANALPGVDPPTPAYSQLDLTTILATFAAHPSVRAEITPRFIPPPPIWAFVSVTNNQTQLVTTLTPSLGKPLSTPKKPLAQGHWAGAGACLNVEATQVTFNSGCGAGSFPRPSIGPDGRFEADGVYFVSVGPPRPSFTPPPAHFSGIVDGTSLKLAVTSGNVTFPLTMQYGSTAPCPAPCP